jgi:hypothetical protein
MTSLIRRLLRLDRASVALLTAVAVLGTAIGITVASPPAALRPADLDGRTWMSVATGDGPGLVLLNGFSGLVEARAAAAAGIPADARFATSGPSRTLLAGDDGTVVVDDGLHTAETAAGATRGAALVGDEVLAVDGDGQLTVRGPGGDPTALDLDGDDVLERPVVAADGAAWILAEQATGPRAWRVDDDLEPRSHDVPAGTTALVVADGDPAAITPTGMVFLDGDRADRSVPDGAVVPTVVEDPDGTWAHAEGDTVTVLDDGEEFETTLDDSVEQLVLWSSAVLAITADGVQRIADGEADPVGEFDRAPQVHLDGGLLWLTAGNLVTAVWDDQTEVTFELTSIDLDLCVDDCDASDVQRFLDEQEEEEEQEQGDEPDERTTTTTTSPRRSESRQIRPPSVEPTVPTTTTTAPPTTTTTTRPTTTTTTRPTTATTAADRDDDRQPPSSAVRPTSSTTTTPPPQPAGPPPTAAPPTTRPPLIVLPPLFPGPRPPGLPPRDPGPGPGRPPPQEPAPPTTQAPTPTTRPSTTTTTEPTTPTTEPPAGSVGLVLGVDRSGGSATATVAVQGRASDCGALVSRSTTGTVSWSGAASGSTQVALQWTGIGSSSSSSEQVTIANVGSGPLTVSFSACGLQTSRTAGDADAPPEVSAVSVDPAQPTVGESFTASVSVDARDGWSVSGASWSGGPCGAERNVGGSGLSQSFTADQPGRFCVSVVVTLAGPGGAESSQSRSGSADVVDTTTTTTTEPTTTTTRPRGTTTTTTTEPTTTTTEAPTTTTTEVPEP